MSDGGRQKDGSGWLRFFLLVVVAVTKSLGWEKGRDYCSTFVLLARFLSRNVDGP